MGKNFPNIKADVDDESSGYGKGLLSQIERHINHNSRLLCAFICLLGCFFCILPIYTIKQPSNTLRDSQSVDVIQFQYVTISSIAIGIKMILDLLIDCIFLAPESRKGFIARLSLILTIIVPSALMISLGTTNLYSVSTVFSLRILIRTLSGLIFIGEYFKHIWRTPCIVIAFLCYTIAIILTNYSMYTSSSSVTKACIISAAIMYNFSIFSTLPILFKCTQKFRNQIFQNETNFTFILEYLYGLFIICIFILITIYYSYIESQQWYSFTNSKIIIISYLELFIAIFISHLHMKSISDEIKSFKDALEMKRMFVRYVSHEIRTPLNTVFLGMELLLCEILKLGSFPALIDLVEDIKVSGDLALQTINDFLLYDKTDSGSLALELEQTYIYNLMKDSIRPFFIQALQAGIAIVFENTNLENISDITRLVSYIDRNKFSQVIRNLISNALKFSAKNSTIHIGYSIVTTTAATSEQLNKLPKDLNVHYNNKSLSIFRISVRDNGPGITKDDQEKLFKSIVQFNPGKLQNGGGSGLGLWISQRIATLHGGSLSVYSDGEGQGSTFFFDIPVFESTISKEDVNENEDEDDSFKSTFVERPRTLSLVSNSGAINVSNSIIGGVGGGGGGAEGECFSSVSSSIRTSFTSDSHAPISIALENIQMESFMEDNNNHHDNNDEDDEDDDSDNDENDNDDDNHQNIDNHSENNTSFSESISVSHRKLSRSSKYSRTSSKYAKSDSDTIASTISTTNTILNINNSNNSLINSNQHKKLRILVVDDACMNRKMLIRILESRCDSSNEAEDGIEAVKMIRATITGDLEAFDVILMDNIMPNMDGLTATKVIREMGYKGLILGVTGNVLPDDIKKFMICGANRVLCKPLDVKVFDATIAEMS